MSTIRRMVPCLWLDGQAEEAAKFYVSVFDGSRITRVSYYGEAGREAHGHEPGKVMVVAFELEGQPFTALNGGPQFKFNEAISFQVMCETQQEIDRFWAALSREGTRRLSSVVGSRTGMASPGRSSPQRYPI